MNACMALWSHDFIKLVADWLFTQGGVAQVHSLSDDTDAVLFARGARRMRIGKARDESLSFGSFGTPLDALV